ncbi:MAG TPA: FAD-binding oxidoreductase [Vicinamibacterales bacterium]|jgi:FAD/FMN-containing dehydrogenase|nr:FAD-binding oxidoreductase [Vicinamibacterales bacterium]
MSVDPTSLAQLAPGFTGRLLYPTDAEYEDARRVHNGLVDKRPALIARCCGVADICDAVKLARALRLEVAVRGGGHNVAGHATIDGGLMIDLAPMKGIHVDPRARLTRAQGGVLWSEFNRETQLHGLATTGGVVGSTGIAGLTLGGGLGWLMPKYGLALDNLRSAEMVMADGSVKHASADENTDLFWAIRGGGGNFGIAASFEYVVHPVGPIIAGGVVAHPHARAREVLKFFREQCAAAPDELMLVGGLIHAPDGSGAKLTAIVAAHCGSVPEGEGSLQPFKAFGPPVMDAMGPITYCAQNALFDAALPRSALNYWKSQFLTDLSDEAIRVLVDRFESCESPMSQIVIEHFHGAASRVPASATACALRVSGFNVAIVSQWMDPRQNDACIAWCRQTFDALKPFLAEVRYVNYLDHDETGDPAAAAYGANYRRLRELKAKYDPENFFHTNVNIRPA